MLLCWLRCRGSGLLLLVLGELLDGAEDGGDLAVEEGEVEVDDGAAGVQDDVDGEGEEIEIVADGLAHAALDAVAVDGLAHDFADGKADAGAGGVGVAERFAVCTERGAEAVEVAHLLGELLAADLVDALVVGVFA